MASLVLKNAHLFDGSCRKGDLVIDGAFFVGPDFPPARASGAAKGSSHRPVADLSGKTVLPAFVDVHTHLDRALTSGLITNESGTLAEAIARCLDYFASVTPDEVYERGRQAAEMAIAHGTGAVRAHTEVTMARGLAFVEAILQLRRDLAGRLEIQVVAAPLEGEGRHRILALLETALGLGVEVVGGYPSLEPDPRGFIDDMFAVAKAWGVPLDFHVDETDGPTVEVLDYVAGKTIAEGYEGKVTAAHCSSLALVPQETADRVIAKVAEAGINVVTLPSCNLFLLGRQSAGGAAVPHPLTRGVTRVRELRRAGVRVAYASDNLRDPFRPFGNADMLEEGLLTAQVLQMGYPPGLLEVLRMGTYDPAGTAGLPNYGLAPGDFADLVVLDAPDPVEALLSGAPVDFVLHRGEVVAGRQPVSVGDAAAPWDQFRVEKAREGAEGRRG